MEIIDNYFLLLLSLFLNDVVTIIS
jgi:hypothetical protein